MSNKGKYWYLVEIWSCVLCGKEKKIRERQYTPKPKDPSMRTVWHEDACYEHF
jgi:hypothetical protein